jgi:hypothetical protein
VLIDAIPGETEAPTSKAESVRAVVSQRSGYRELRFGPVTLGGREAFRWEFEEDGERRVDYFLRGCGGGYAILGSTRASRFGRYEKTFRAVAQSLDCKEGAQRATEPEQETPRECDSEELQGALVINSGDVGCDEAREVGSNSRGPNSARGPAGWDCSGFATSLEGSKLSAVEGYSCSRGNDRLSLYSEEGDAATTPDSGSGSGTDSLEIRTPGLPPTVLPTATCRPATGAPATARGQTSDSGSVARGAERPEWRTGRKACAPARPDLPSSDVRSCSRPARRVPPRLPSVEAPRVSLRCSASALVNCFGSGRSCFSLR